MARRNTLTLLAATMLGTIDSNALVPIIALYAKAVGSDLLQIGIIVGLFSAVHAPANLFFGRIEDRFGRKLPLQVGLAWDAVSLFLYSVATTLLLLALVRISHGIGSGFVGPSSMAIMPDTSPRERKGRAMAIYGMALAFAVVIGFGMAGPIVARDGFAALFTSSPAHCSSASFSRHSSESLRILQRSRCPGDDFSRMSGARCRPRATRRSSRCTSSSARS